MGLPNRTLAPSVAAMLRFVSEKKIVPIIDQVFPLQEANAALKRMRVAGQFGKIVLTQ